MFICVNPLFATDPLKPTGAKKARTANHQRLAGRLTQPVERVFRRSGCFSLPPHGGKAEAGDSGEEGESGRLGHDYALGVGEDEAVEDVVPVVVDS